MINGMKECFPKFFIIFKQLNPLVLTANLGWPVINMFCLMFEISSHDLNHESPIGEF